MTRYTPYIAPAVLILIGSLQMLGDLLGVPTLRAFGLATNASPAPKVFTIQNGFETYANDFYLTYTNQAGEEVKLQITPKVYQRLDGPYNRRNAYGAATSYGPVLAKNSLTQPMLQSVIQYAFCGDAPILKEFGVTNVAQDSNVFIVIEPFDKNLDTNEWQLNLEADCDN